VYQANIAFREFLGSNRHRLEPGMHLNIPFFHNVRKFPLTESSWDLHNMHAFTKDNVPIKASGTIFCKIFDPELAAYAVADVWSAVQSVGSSCARAIIGRYEYDRIISERNGLTEALREDIGDSIKHWGISCTRFELQDFGPQNDAIARQMEKQMEAERHRRENELITLTLIRTAEGDKSSAILKSEGVLAASENEAKGRFIAVTKSAEADAIERGMQAKAWKDQLDTLAQSTGSVESAAHFLLELQRLRHLQAVAEGPNSKI
ncbi:hypothetical protein B484DRAFT_307183, partial [Ochromonadaceae sp. CCMP2298]